MADRATEKRDVEAQLREASLRKRLADAHHEQEIADAEHSKRIADARRKKQIADAVHDLEVFQLQQWLLRLQQAVPSDAHPGQHVLGNQPGAAAGTALAPQMPPPPPPSAPEASRRGDSQRDPGGPSSSGQGAAADVRNASGLEPAAAEQGPSKRQRTSPVGQDEIMAHGSGHTSYGADSGDVPGTPLRPDGEPSFTQLRQLLWQQQQKLQQPRQGRALGGAAQPGGVRVPETPPGQQAAAAGMEPPSPAAPPRRRATAAAAEPHLLDSSGAAVGAPAAIGVGPREQLKPESAAGSPAATHTGLRVPATAGGVTNTGDGPVRELPPPLRLQRPAVNPVHQHLSLQQASPAAAASPPPPQQEPPLAAAAPPAPSPAPLAAAAPPAPPPAPLAAVAPPAPPPAPLAAAAPPAPPPAPLAAVAPPAPPPAPRAAAAPPAPSPAPRAAAASPAPPPAPQQLPRSLQELQTGLNQQAAARPAAAARTSAASAAGPSSSSAAFAAATLPHLHLDLGGRTLVDDPQHPLPDGRLRVPPGTHLRNGKLVGCCVLVEQAGPPVRFENMEIVGTPGQLPGWEYGGQQHRHRDLAVVWVLGAGCSAVLSNCHVKAEPGSSEHTDCVLVSRGGRAELSNCTLEGAPCAGVWTHGVGSFARVAGTTAVHNGVAGFMAAGKGTVQASRCMARLNGKKLHGQGASGGTGDGSSGGGGGSGTADDDEDGEGHGFAAIENGRMAVDGESRAEDNWMNGFVSAGRGSKLEVGTGCTAVQNESAGFCAMDSGVLVTGNGCDASRNLYAGFVAQEGGRLSTGMNNFAYRNGSFGFVSSGSKAQLVVGSSSTAASNPQAGFLAEKGGALAAGGACTSKANGSGFKVQQKGSLMTLGRCCRGTRNVGEGFLVMDNGLLKTEPECQAGENQAEGFAAAGGRLQLGHGCISQGNGSDGFTASDGGTLDARAGACLAKGNGQHGFCCEDAGSHLWAGPGSQARGSKGSGFVARLGGDLEMCHGAVARDNAGWGVLVSDRGSLLTVACPYDVADNNTGGVGAEAGGNLCERKDDKGI